MSVAPTHWLFQWRSREWSLDLVSAWNFLALRRRLGLSFGELGRFLREQGDVDILEDLTGGDAEESIGGFDEIVTLRAGVLPAKRISEGDAGGELFGLNEEAGAVGDPLI